MGTIKLELELPEFKNELNINITIKRDGEVLVNKTETPSSDSAINIPPIKKNDEKKISQKKPKSGGMLGGNLMGMTDF